MRITGRYARFHFREMAWGMSPSDTAALTRDEVARQPSAALMAWTFLRHASITTKETRHNPNDPPTRSMTKRISPARVDRLSPAKLAAETTTLSTRVSTTMRMV